jgi:hypothetical protein
MMKIRTVETHVKLPHMSFLQDILINKKYRVEYRIREGGYGLV